MPGDYYLDDASIIHVITRAQHSYRVAPHSFQQTPSSFLFQMVKFCLEVLKRFISEGQKIGRGEVHDWSLTPLKIFIILMILKQNFFEVFSGITLQFSTHKFWIQIAADSNTLLPFPVVHQTGSCTAPVTAPII